MVSTVTREQPQASAPDASNDTVSYTMCVRGGRFAYVEIPRHWCDFDHDGTLLFLPEAVELLDRVQALAQVVDKRPTPGHIVSLRKALGMTQDKFGRKLRVDKATVYRWEKGLVVPSPESAAAIERLRARSVKPHTIFSP